MSQRPKRSGWWEFFVEESRELAQCKICSAKVSFKTTVSNLGRHIKRHHTTDDDIPAEMKKKIMKINETKKMKIEEIIETEDKTNITVSSSSSVTSEFGPLIPRCSMITPIEKSYDQIINLPSKITPHLQNDADNELLKLFYCDYQPFSTVTNKGFTEFVKALNPSYVLPSQKKISKDLIPALYDQRLSEIAEIINKIEKLTLTADCWTSIKNEYYLSLTAHYVDEGELKSSLLSCNVVIDDQEGENMASEIKQILDFWNIGNKIMMVISDDDNSVKKAVKNKLKMKHYGCAALKINLIVDAALQKNHEIQKVVYKIKTIVTHFRRCTESAEKLMDYKKKNGCENQKKLMICDPASWNSIYHMLKRFVDIEECVKTTGEMLDEDIPLLSPNDWKIAKGLCIILEPFESLTRDLSGKMFRSASCLIVVINGMLDVFNRLLDTNEYGEFDENINEVIRFIISEIVRDDRFGSLEKSETFEMCTFLDPRFKTLPFRDQTTKTKIFETLKEMMIPRITNSQTSVPIISTISSTDFVVIPPKKRPSIWESLEKKIQHSATSDSAENKAIVEIESYLADGYLERHEDPLKWWHDRKYYYPILSEIAKEWFSIVPTSVPCEQIFSKKGIISWERRSMLSGQEAKMLSFLNANMECLKK